MEAASRFATSLVMVLQFVRVRAGTASHQTINHAMQSTIAPLLMAAVRKPAIMTVPENHTVHVSQAMPLALIRSAVPRLTTASLRTEAASKYARTQARARIVAHATLGIHWHRMASRALQ